MPSSICANIRCNSSSSNQVKAAAAVAVARTSANVVDEVVSCEAQQARRRHVQGAKLINMLLNSAVL